MGLTARCDEGDITVFYNGKVLQKYFLENWSAIKQAELGGADYVESFILRDGGSGRGPPTCTVDQLKAILADIAATGKEISLPDIRSMVFLDLPRKDFNVEVQVDPAFIHSFSFGWNGFMNISAAQMSADLETARTVFRQQPEYKLIETRCNDLKAANISITNIVVLGNGSISTPSSPHGANITDSGYYGLAGNPIDQLAAIMEISRLLGGTSRCPGLRPLGGTSKPLPCVFQDPQTPKLEQKFLRSLGHATVNDPDAFDLIDANSLVIYIHNPGMVEYLMKGVWPAAIVAWQSPGRVPSPEDLDPTEVDLLDQEDLELEPFEKAYNVLSFMESKADDGVPKEHQVPQKCNFYLRKDLDGAANFLSSV